LKLITAILAYSPVEFLSVSIQISIMSDFGSPVPSSYRIASSEMTPRAIVEQLASGAPPGASASSIANGGAVLQASEFFYVIFFNSYS